MKKTHKNTVTIFLSIFSVVMLGFTVATVDEYFRFRNGVAVDGIVTDMDTSRVGRGGRKYYATIGVTVQGTEISERIKLPHGRVVIGGVRISKSDIVIGDTIPMLAVPRGDGYDIAVAEDVRNPWPELLWETFTIVLIGFSFSRLVNRNRSV